MRRLAVLIVCACALPVSAAQAWTWPVDGPVLRPFRFDHSHPYAGGQHRGVDLGAPSGSPVLAPVEGVVSFAGTVPTGGKTVSIQTSFGYTATLVHLGSIGVARGALVGEASVVGTVGPSGVVDLPDPYVYFGARVTSDPQGYVDPLTLLPPRLALRRRRLCARCSRGCAPVPADRCGRRRRRRLSAATARGSEAAPLARLAERSRTCDGGRRLARLPKSPSEPVGRRSDAGRADDRGDAAQARSTEQRPRPRRPNAGTPERRRDGAGASRVLSRSHVAADQGSRGGNRRIAAASAPSTANRFGWHDQRTDGAHDRSLLAAGLPQRWRVVAVADLLAFRGRSCDEKAARHAPYHGCR